MATKKVTVTIPEDLLDEIRAEAAERGMSAYVAEALRFKRDRDRLRELSDWLQEEHGPLTEEERRGPSGPPPAGRREAARPQVRDRRDTRRRRSPAEGTGHRLHLGR
ncbi:CopG family transcriptional regulator [Streptomyces anulatus]